MRLPWISIDADGQTRGRLLGRLLGVHELQGVGMTISLWHAAVEFSRDGDFTGAVPAPEFIAAACSWPIDDAVRLVKALQQVGIIATHPDLRVRGLDRYRSTWLKNHNFHRMSAKGRGHPPATEEKTKQTESQDEDEDEDECNDVAPPTKIWPEPPKPKRERKPSAAEDFFGWLSATRATVRGLTEEPRPAASRMNKTFGDALTTCGRPELEGRYRAFLADGANAARDPPWPWQVFGSTWSWRKAVAESAPRPKFLTGDELKNLYPDGAA